MADDPRATMGELAATIYGHPGRDLLQIGITGTSGKTTTAYLVEGGLKTVRSTGLIGTVEMRIGDERIKSERTTPEATDLQALFAVMRERGTEAVAMEVSSHALVLGRVDGCVFDIAVFTNLSPEHMEFHSGMEDYFQAKAQLFTPERSRLGVVNADDEYGRRLAKEAGVPVVTFSAEGHPDADWRAEDVEVGPMDSTFTVIGPKGERISARAPLPGTFNVANTLSAIVALAAAGLDPQAAADGVAAVPGVPGRLERVDAGQPYLAVVDYAHKTDAVESVLRALRKVTEGRVHVVLGCGGDRDKTKRVPMGAAAARLADTAVLTSDNPRSEDPSRSSPPCSTAPPPCPPTSGARCRSSRTGPPRSPPPSTGRGPATRCWSPARAMSRDRTSPGWCVPSTTVRCSGKPSRKPRDELVIALSLAEIAEVVGGQTHDIPDPSVQVTGPVVRDSREAGPGSLFAAFVGERVDGHDYAAQVVGAGAVAVLASRPVGVPAIVVDDVQAALGALARHVVARLGTTLVALTGSAGKTSTKDLIAQVLRRKAPTVFTPARSTTRSGCRSPRSPPPRRPGSSCWRWERAESAISATSPV
ncbi:hypothetical protein SHKM778_71320 [Streptomyces sp. KM77-8]|uniref:UDP-N-acetylmuramoyl-L-alanyl-D-glutamate--2,6-diaminopimelate ligase n=1 Tax=Streptomyces haneummycinicus TaxID=3074435 RepID=A0AAT9HSX6_9ACTN